ncbi:MAG: hypothetical protein OXH57_12480 [Ekhidna sp.]|nr:hypothetical protein [Ekhidna sp.]
MKQFIFISILLLLVISCDPCPDCGDPLASEPTVEMIFINQDSIHSIDLRINFLESQDSIFSVVKADLDDLRDSLRKVQDSLNIGRDEYEDEKASLLDLIKQEQQDSLFYENQEIGETTAILNAARSTINSGLILVNRISLPETGSTITFSDSATVWDFPLSFREEFSVYDVLIRDENFTIELDYETFTEVDEERNIRIRAQNIRVIDTMGFDSLNICEENCIDGEASFTFYF